MLVRMYHKTPTTFNFVVRFVSPWVYGGQGETYSLFQDKVDEAEARLEVATDANNTCKRRYMRAHLFRTDDIQNSNISWNCSFSSLGAH